MSLRSPPPTPLVDPMRAEASALAGAVAKASATAPAVAAAVAPVALAPVTAPRVPAVAVAKAPRVAAAEMDSSSLIDLITTTPVSLLGTPVAPPPSAGSNRSGRLSKKNAVCPVPVAKRAEHKLRLAFGDDADDVSDVAAKVRSYLDMYKEPLTLKVLDAIRTLVGVKEKAQVDFEALGFTAGELELLGMDAA